MFLQQSVDLLSSCEPWEESHMPLSVAVAGGGGRVNFITALTSGDVRLGERRG